MTTEAFFVFNVFEKRFCHAYHTGHSIDTVPNVKKLSPLRKPQRGYVYNMWITLGSPN
jgi:hypothetical protein